MELRGHPPRVTWPVRVDSGPGTPTRGQAQGPRWRRVGPGLYVPADVERTVDQRIAEEWCRVPEAVLSGWAACRWYGGVYFDGNDVECRPLPVPLIVAPDRCPRSGQGARIVRQPIAAEDRVDRYRLVLPVPGRTAPPRGLRRARAAFEVAGTRSCSPPESRLRLVCRGLGWNPMVNVEVFDLDGRFLARPDLFVPELGLAIEYDGSMHRTRQRHRRDNERVHLLRRAGVEVQRRH